MTYQGKHQQRQRTSRPRPSDHTQIAQVAVAKDRQSDRSTSSAICLFTDSLEPSGVGEHMLALAGQLIAAYAILFVCPPTPKGQRILERARQLGCQTSALEVRGDPAAQAALGKHLRARAIEVFHCHAGIGWEGHAGVHAARACGVPVVVRTEHLPYLITDPQEHQAYQQVVQAVDRVICVSQEVYNTHVAAGVPPAKLSVVRNGIVAHTPAADRVGVRARFGLAPDAKIVLTVARMTEQKGHTYLLSAIPAVLAQVPEAHFLWVGEGPLEAALRRQMQELGVAPSSLIFAGRRSDVPELLAASDLFVLPSLFEGLPLVVLEALANSIPVVGTRSCGTSEAIEDGVTGRLVPARDNTALAAATVEALTQPALTDQWRRAGRSRIAGEFSVQRMTGEVVTIYEGLRGRQATAVARRARHADTRRGPIPQDVQPLPAQRAARQDTGA